MKLPSFEQLAQTARGFQESRVLLTAIELDLFAAVGEDASAAEVAERAGTDPRATEMLLNALVALGALTKTGDRFRNTLTSPGNQWAALMHTVHLWERWSTLTECVRSGGPRKRSETGDRGRQWITAFIAAMHFYAAERAPAVVNAVGAGGVRRMLDVGGGSGAYSIAFAEANPNLRADILDLSPVLAIARGHIKKAGLAKRIGTKPGDLRADSLGKGYDLVFISAICHMLGPEENLDLFRRAYRALAPGGRVAVRDFILNPAKTAPLGAALFSLNMLVGTADGASYSEGEYTTWLREAGFENVERIRLADPGSQLMLAMRLAR
jgi:ubiquinone/menaquinone biosynthesis C-methylase UbiE